MRFLPFDQARAYVHNCRLKNQVEWRAYCKSGNKPKNIPSQPRDTYRGKGWKNSDDWLGTGKSAYQKKIFRSFEDARVFARSLDLKSSSEWQIYSKSGNRPDDIPSDPSRVYKDKGWKGWKDWVDTKNITGRKRQFLLYEDAKLFMHKLGLKNFDGWRDYCKSGNKPSNIPGCPHFIYKDSGWNGYGEWLGTGNIASFKRQFRSFCKARAAVRKLNLRNSSEWNSYCKSGDKPSDIPSHPGSAYRNVGWEGVHDWLGIRRADFSKKNFCSFKNARAFARKLKLNGKADWRGYCKSGDKPDDIPSEPSYTYRYFGWKCWCDWFGKSHLNCKGNDLDLNSYLPFKEARSFIHGLGLMNKSDWLTYCKSGGKPDDIPSNPEFLYREVGWLGLHDWLGVFEAECRKKQFRSYEKARAAVRKLNLKSSGEWECYCKSGNKPPDIPSNPYSVYKNSGWLDWNDWLENKNICTWKMEFKPFEKARKFAHGLSLKTYLEWKEYARSGNRPHDIPSNPHFFYKNRGWRGYRDWIGVMTLSE